jgi:hypothetical protein
VTRRAPSAWGCREPCHVMQSCTYSCMGPPTRPGRSGRKAAPEPRRSTRWAAQAAVRANDSVLGTHNHSGAGSIRRPSQRWLKRADQKDCVRCSARARSAGRDRADQRPWHGSWHTPAGSLGLSATNPSLIGKRCLLHSICSCAMSWASRGRGAGRCSRAGSGRRCQSVRSGGMWRCPRRIRRDGWPLGRWSGWAPLRRLRCSRLTASPNRRAGGERAGREDGGWRAPGRADGSAQHDPPA